MAEKICKNCKFRDEDRYCQSVFLYENGMGDDDNKDDNALVYSYFEGGSFRVGDNFGCVHFEEK